jgi:hypothetical protein
MMKAARTSETLVNFGATIQKTAIFVEALLMGNIRIVKPADSGSFFCNYKEYCSIGLMTILNADYECTYLNAGCNEGFLVVVLQKLQIFMRDLNRIS